MATEISQQTYLIIKILCTVLGVTIVASVTYILLRTEPVETESTTTLAQFAQLQTVADIHRSRLTEFTGVCSEMALPQEIRCHESSEAFAIEKTLENGSYACADSTGHNKVQLFTKGTKTSCR